MAEAKPYEISKQLVWEAYKRSRRTGALPGGRRVHRGVRDGPEEQPLQDLESDVLGVLLPAAGAARRDSEGQAEACGRWGFPRSLIAWRRWS